MAEDREARAIEPAAPGRASGVPEEQVIQYPEKYSERGMLSGASSFAGSTDHPDSRYYVFHDYYNMESDETLHILTHFKTIQQTTEFTCGAACSLMVLNWFGKTKYHEMAVADLIETLPGEGSSVERIADFFDLIGWNVDHHADTKPRFETPQEMEAFFIDCIDRDIPIMVDWIDWAGHWQVVIGVDTCGTEDPYDDVLILADPYDVTDHFQDGHYVFSLARFFYMWREGRGNGKSEPYEQPFVAAWPKEGLQ